VSRRARLGALVGAALALLVLLLALAAERTPASAAVTIDVSHAVPYGPPGDRVRVLDAYVPRDGRKGRPAVVVVHGGGWVGGERADEEANARAFAAAGFAAFSIDYRIGGPTAWPDELDDVQAAIAWVQDHAATYAVDPAKVGLFGGSAGGNLVMLAATHGPSAGHPPVRAVVSWSGPSDLTVIAPVGVSGDVLASPSTVPIAGADPPAGCAGDAACLGVMAPSFLQTFMGCTIEQCADRYRAASPALGVTASTPPMFLASAEIDLVPAGQAYAMVNALTTAGITSRLLVVPGVGHADSYASTATTPSIAFLQQFVVDGADPHVAPNTPPTTLPGSVALPGLVDGWKIPVASTPDVSPWALHRGLIIGSIVVGVALVLGLLLFLDRQARWTDRR
jgi:acetyl esterase/lipase